jgi:hypothetical protein
LARGGFVTTNDSEGIHGEGSWLNDSLPVLTHDPDFDAAGQSVTNCYPVATVPDLAEGTRH